MSNAQALLYESANGNGAEWTLSGGDNLAEMWWQGADLQALIDAWPEIYRDHRANLKQCAIVPRSTAFLFDRFPRSDVAGSTKRSTLRFRLEADLPFSAEELACDFQFGSISGSSPQVSAVACQYAQWSALLAQLGQCNCTLELLTPKSLLLLQAVAEQPIGFSQNCLILLHLDGQFEIVSLAAGQVVLWRIPGDQANALRDWHIVQEETSDVERLVLLASNNTESDLSPNDMRAMLNSAEVPVRVVDELQLNRQLVSRMLAGRTTAWFDLSGDEQLSGSGMPQRRALAWQRYLLLIAGCLLVAALAFYWRSERIRTAVSELQEQQIELVRLALPEQKINSAVMARLKSEHTKLSGSRSTDKQIDLPTSVLPTMRQVIQCLPVDVPIAVHELRIDGTAVYLDVEVAQFHEAGLLAQALQASGLDMAPPSTSTAKDGKIRVQLRGNRAGDRQR